MTERSSRRTQYTRAAIKDAFLDLVAKGGWRRLSVTLLCRKADIARATFYLHYANLDEVLTDVLIDAFQIQEETSAHFFARLRQTAEAGRLTEDSFLPLCQRAAESPKYRALLLDPDLPGPILSFLYDMAKDSMVPVIMRTASLSRPEAEILFRFLLQGSFAVNTALGWEQNDRWYAMQDLIFRFKLGGLASAERKGKIKARLEKEAGFPHEKAVRHFCGRLLSSIGGR